MRRVPLVPIVPVEPEDEEPEELPEEPPELAALAEGDWDGAVITQPVPVSRMHALMAQALVQDSESFFAALQ